MTVASIRAAMGTALRTIDGLNVTDYVTDTINTPHAMFDFDIVPHLTFGRADEAPATYAFTIQVFATRSADLASQRYLDTLRDPATAGGLVRTVEENATLAAACDYARVTSIGKVQIASPHPNVEYLMVPFEVEVVV